MGHYVKGINQHGLHKRPPNSCSSPDIVVSKENEEDNQGRLFTMQPWRMQIRFRWRSRRVKPFENRKTLTTEPELSRGESKRWRRLGAGRSTRTIARWWQGSRLVMIWSELQQAKRTNMRKNCLILEEWSQLPCRRLRWTRRAGESRSLKRYSSRGKRLIPRFST